MEAFFPNSCGLARGRLGGDRHASIRGAARPGQRRGSGGSGAADSSGFVSRYWAGRSGVAWRRSAAFVPGRVDRADRARCPDDVRWHCVVLRGRTARRAAIWTIKSIAPMPDEKKNCAHFYAITAYSRQGLGRQKVFPQFGQKRLCLEKKKKIYRNYFMYSMALRFDQLLKNAKTGAIFLGGGGGGTGGSVRFQEIYLEEDEKLCCYS